MPRRRARRLGWVLLGLILAQGAVGYTQYFNGLPAGLVWVHVTGAVLIWITALRLLFALRDRGAAAGTGNRPRQHAQPRCKPRTRDWPRGPGRTVGRAPPG